MSVVTIAPSALDWCAVPKSNRLKSTYKVEHTHRARSALWFWPLSLWAAAHKCNNSIKLAVAAMHSAQYCGHHKNKEPRGNIQSVRKRLPARLCVFVCIPLALVWAAASGVRERGGCEGLHIRAVHSLVCSYVRMCDLCRECGVESAAVRVMPHQPQPQPASQSSSCNDLLKLFAL